nr:hypothetical protein [Tanacetum cinerariifolium]
MSDSTGVSVSLGEISLEGNKSWESNIGDSDNTGDEGKIAGKKTSMSKRYLVKLFEESREMLPGTDVPVEKVVIDSKQDTDGSESDFESDQQEYEEEVKDDDDEEDEVVHTPSNSDDEDDANLKSKNYDKIEGDEDRGMDDATNQFNDDVDARLNEPTQTDKEVIQDKKAVPCTHTSTLLTTLVSVIPESSPVYTTIPQLLQTFTSLLLLTTPTPPPIIETTNTPSTIPNFVSVFRFNERVNALEKEVAELKKDPLHTQVTALFDDHLDTRMGATKEEFMNFLSISEESLNQVNLKKVSSQPQSTYKAADTLTEFELMKIHIDKMNKSESYLASLAHQECNDGLIKSYNLDKDFFSFYDVYSLKGSRKDKDKDEGPSTGSDQGYKKRKTSKDTEPTTGLKIKDSTSRSSKGTKSQPKSSRNTIQSEEPEFEENPKGRDYPFDLTKPLPLVKVGNRQKVPTDYFFNNDLKYLQGGTSTMTYTISLTKTKAIHYDLPGIKDMVPNIWSPVKVTLDRYAKWGISYCDDVVDFAIALKMFTRSLVIQKRVKDLQIGVESYQKKTNVTKPDTDYDGVPKRPTMYLNLLRHKVVRHSKSENKGLVPTKIELVLEQTQEGTTYEVSVSAEGVQELKRKVKIKGEKKKALLTLR